MRRLPQICLLVTAFATPAFVPAHGATECDYEKTLISLKALNKPVTEILQDIEKQTEYTIEVDSADILNDKKSIGLNQAPLHLTLKRLFKDINYSIICNDEQKILTVVLLDKSGLPSSEVAKNTGDVPTNGMAGLTKAMNEYLNNDKAVADLPQQEPEDYKGLTAAFKEFASNKENGIVPVTPQDQKSPMAEVTAAFDQYAANGQNQDSLVTSEGDGGEMAGLAVAMNDYRNPNTPKYTPSQNKQPTTMDGAVAAMDEYKKLHHRN